MKRLFGNLTLLILLIGGRAHLTAGECYDPSNSNGCAYYAEIEALYWKTYHCPIFVAERFDPASSSPEPHDQFYLNGAYDGGTRIRLGTQSCACFFDLSYLYFCSDEHESASRDGFNTMVMAGNIGDSDRVLSAKSTGKFRYQNLDGRFGYDLYLARCLDAFLYSNARLMRIDFSNKTTGVPVDPLTPPGDPTLENFFKQESEFKGGGVGFGVGTRARLWGRLSLHGTGGVMAIYGASKLKNFTSRSIDDPQVRVNVLKTPQIQHHLFPGLELRAGLDYGFCICKRPVEVEVGYEIDYYAKVLRYASETEIEFGRAEIPHFTRQNIGFGGPYFRLALTF